ncbi:hypothetical protein DYH09_17045 [bacterium CPR1]|nr:hypothetical protein [bacterium CPR1]
MKTRTALMFGWFSAFLWSLTEWQHYQLVLQLDQRLSNPPADLLGLFGLLFLRNLWLLALPTLLSCWLARRGQPRWAAAVAVSSWLALLGFLGLDLACQKMLGTHIMPFLWFGVDVLNSPPGEGMKFAGGGAAIALPVVFTVLGLLVLVLSVARVSSLLAESLRYRLLVALYPASLLLAVMLPLLFSDPYLIARTYLHLPTRHPELRWLALQSWSAVHPRPVALISVLPRPGAGQQAGVVLSNLGGELDLAGWSLVTRAGNTQNLQGRLPAGESLSVPMKLAESEDVVTLLQGQRMIDQVQYRPEQVETGIPIAFLDPRLGTPFLRRLQDRAKPELERLGPALQRPPELRTRITPQGKPVHVVLLLLESWRFNSVGPTETPRLWKWMQRGLVLEQHYSGSNTSHLGMYSLLYARNPIFYKRDLAHHAPPLFNQILRNAGYDCRLMAGSAFRGWKWLERFLSQPTFDEMWVNPPDKTGWEYWIQSDHEMVSSLPERLRTAERPQFIFCFPQSTHFPYAYPPDFALREPSLTTVGLQDFTLADPVLVKNRYANSVAYLEAEIDSMLSRLDLENTVIIVTGDHGESFWEDTTLAHGTRASEIQCRVPCFILGRGVQPGRISTATCHMDLLPTALHLVTGQDVSVPESQGRDLLAGKLEDEVLIAPLRSVPPYQLVLIHEGLKLQLNVVQERFPRMRPDLGPDPGGAHVEAVGFLNSLGEIQWGWAPPEDRLDGWLGALEREFKRLQGK